MLKVITAVAVVCVSAFLGYACVSHFSKKVVYERSKKVSEEEKKRREEEDDERREKPTEYKMVLIVRSDLKMGKGKIGAQCGHASLGTYKVANKKDPAAVAAWERQGRKKEILKVCSEDEL